MPTSNRNLNRPSLSHIDIEHDLEHKQWNRRSFLQALGLAGSGSMFLAGSTLSAAKLSPLTMALNDTEGERVLVLIRLKGGNDGLNTIVPLNQYDTYANARPKIALPENSLYKLSDEFGLPDFMSPLQKMWGEGQMKVALGVGYEDGNLSHFRSSDIYATAIAEEKEKAGIFGRFYETEYPDFLANPPLAPPAIQIGSIGNLLFDGETNHYAFTVSQPGQLERIAELGAVHDVNNLPNCIYGEQLGFMRGLSNTTYKYADVIKAAYDASSTTADYNLQGDPKPKLAKQLQIIARMIKGKLGTKVYMVTLSGFDTHANQIDRHAELMNDLAASVNAFYEDLAELEMDKDVLAMTFSEFGRRVSENGSKGTDHGTSSTTLFFGGGLDGNGFIGTQPDLDDLNRTGNMSSSMDFRKLYATALREWLCINPDTVDSLFPEGKQESETLGFDCNGIFGRENGAGIFNVPTYQNNRAYIEFELPNDGHVDIQLYDILGKSIGTITNEIRCKGMHKIDVQQALGNVHLSTGQYVYRIFTNLQAASKMIQIK